MAFDLAKPQDIENLHPLAPSHDTADHAQSVEGTALFFAYGLPGNSGDAAREDDFCNLVRSDRNYTTRSDLAKWMGRIKIFRRML